jgi:hypothetical protein
MLLSVDRNITAVAAPPVALLAAVAVTVLLQECV